MTPVTKPYLPPLADILPHLESMWDSRLLSNNGPLHSKLETELGAFLGERHLSLFCNATIGLITAQQALAIKGEVITTPYSFVATTHAIKWMGNEPIFVDIEPDSLCMDPAKIEKAITSKTAAIMPLHCYGNTCRTADIQDIADKHGLKVIYDACHSFGINDEKGSVLRHGDVSVVSFHATKVFNTFEGGLLVAPDNETKHKVDNLKNFGFVDETVVIESGINGKMSEFNAAVGLAQLSHFPTIIEKRCRVDSLYRDLLNPVKGIQCWKPVRQKRRNYSYFPIFIQDHYPLSRDALYSLLKKNDIFGRRYFYPLIPEFTMYRSIFSGRPANIPNAYEAARRVICLPIYPDLSLSEVERISNVIFNAGSAKRSR